MYWVFCAYRWDETCWRHNKGGWVVLRSSYVIGFNFTVQPCKIKRVYSICMYVLKLIFFAGKNCDEDIVDCKENSCPPSATCIDLTGKFYCQCPFNLTGDDCRKSEYAVPAFKLVSSFCYYVAFCRFQSMLWSLWFLFQQSKWIMIYTSVIQQEAVHHWLCHFSLVPNLVLL